MSSRPAPFSPSPHLMSGLRTSAIIGGLLFLLGLFEEPSRAWGGFLMGFVFLVGLALAGGLFICLLTLLGARWATSLQRIPEAMTSALPAGAVLGLLLVAGIPSLYEWSHASVVETDPILQAKSAYLNTGFFALRLVVFFALWIWLTRAMVATSRRRDVDGNPEHTRRQWRLAALFLPVFALTFSLASVDWLMSLEPHWFSTIYALGTLAGLGTSGIAVCILFAVLLGRGPLRGEVRDDQLDDLGKIALSMALFWGYIWYCQYMLIWYTDMPEETSYYVLRREGGWGILSSVNVLMNWAIPFLALMPKRARRSESALLRIAWVMLAGQALNLYVLVAPPLMPDGPALGLWELGPLIGALALFLWLTLRGLTRAPLVPLRAQGEPPGSRRAIRAGGNRPLIGGQADLWRSTGLGNGRPPIPKTAWKVAGCPCEMDHFETFCLCFGYCEDGKSSVSMFNRMIDSTDLHILTTLQTQGRTSNADIARSLEMAPSAIHQRVRKLEQRGVIVGYATRIDPRSVGLGVLAFVHLRTDEDLGANDLPRSLVALPEVLEVHDVAGEDGFLLKVRVRDTDALHRLLHESIGRLPGVVGTRTTIVLRTYAERTELPLCGDPQR